MTAADPLLLRSDAEQRCQLNFREEGDGDGDANVNSFLRMLEWMEIEGAILQAYGELEPQHKLYLCEEERQISGQTPRGGRPNRQTTNGWVISRI